MGRKYADRFTLNSPPGQSSAGTVEIYTLAADPNGLLSAALGDRVFQSGSTNVWVCEGGSVWTLQPTGAEARSELRWSPAGTADPANGIYTTWASVHEAAAALVADNNLQVQITVYSPGATASITPAGAYNMAGIALYGAPTGLGALGQQRVEVATGVSFTNFFQGTENIFLDFLGSAALFTLALAAPNARLIRTGKNATWRASGTAAILAFSGTGGLFIDVEDGSIITGTGAGGGAFEVFQLAAAAEGELRLYDGVNLMEDSIRGGAGSTWNRLFRGMGPLPTTQANMAGTLADFGGASGLYYVPSGADWTNPDPTDVQTALNRMAVVVAALNAGPIG